MIESNKITITVTAPITPTTITIEASSYDVSTNTPVTISGEVTDQNDKPIPNITVTLIDATTNTQSTATTNSSGNYSFTVTFTNAGTYTIYTETGT